MKILSKKYAKALGFVVAGLGIVGFTIWNQRSKEPAVIVKSGESAVESSSGDGTLNRSSEDVPGSGFVSEREEVETIPIFFSGAVVRPGVYDVGIGSYLYEALELAGGLSDQVVSDYIHLVYRIEEPMSIYIPDGEEIRAVLEGAPGASALVEAGIRQGIVRLGDNVSGGGETGAHGDSVSPDKVNINTATVEQLKSLPGVGESTAAAIIRYRENTGSFSRIEDIMKVPGIKQGKFDALKDYIMV